MVKSRISSISDGYIALYKDLKFEVLDNIVYIPTKSSSKSILLNCEYDYSTMFKELTQFTISSEAADLIIMRYGLYTGQGLTLHECGEVLGVSDECIRSRLRSSFRKIKNQYNLRSTLGRLPLTEGGQRLLENAR